MSCAIFLVGPVWHHEGRCMPVGFLSHASWSYAQIVRRPNREWLWGRTSRRQFVASKVGPAPIVGCGHRGAEMEWATAIRQPWPVGRVHEQCRRARRGSEPAPPSPRNGCEFVTLSLPLALIAVYTRCCVGMTSWENGVGHTSACIGLQSLSVFQHPATAVPFDT